MGAGTDADVFITLYGDQGESGAMVLDDKKNNFEIVGIKSVIK